MLTLVALVVLEDRSVHAGGIRFATGRGGAWHRFNPHPEQKRAQVRS